jgi:hypothetical protein
MTKRLVLDLGIVLAFIAEYFCEQVIFRNRTPSALFLIFNPLLIFVATACLLGFTRGLAEGRIFASPITLWAGIIEWIFLVLISYVVTCILDVMRHPPEDFITVFGFNLFVTLIPGVIVSTGVYAAGRSLVRL